ncbi:hypothetical protein DVH24_027440 [Malus domestica]|uniref:Protein kinase domain-containing protein n=1 Tax=Malus domestica TaxID=3750 RepID=A0A498H928_MALDO|nr:hypothetical protein DVH24_027440 [Malus domestica]
MTAYFLASFRPSLAELDLDPRVNERCQKLSWVPTILLGTISKKCPSVHAQDDQSGFISLDCGQPSNSSYSESTTGIDYISDAAFISTGVSKSVAPAYKATHQLQAAYVRSFPRGVKNCYKVNITKNTKYLIRAAFLYGNYDGLNKLPKFDLVIGASYWDSVAFTDASLSTIKEVVHIPTLDYINVCLLNKGTGDPFISSLELRPLKNTTYLTPTGSLALSFRLDVGSTVNQTYRYPYDALDRIWQPFNFNKWTQLATSLTVDAQSHNDYHVPSIVMRSASTPLDPSDTMDFNWNAPDTSTQYYIFIHFAEFQLLKANQSRSFNITLNGDHWFGPFAPAYLSTITMFSPSALTGGNYSFSLVQTENSTLPPILNAMEVYTLIDLSQSETDTDDGRNKLNGSVPADLIERSKSGSLSLSGYIHVAKKRKETTRGGFGKVYHGLVDDTQVKLLIRVHHRNLTSLVGYCNEGTNMALIYEFMANGNLDSHLLGENNNANVLTWEGRLQIATDAAQGLEYLHNGCKPPIVHRDVKTTNILLAENFQAKLADFGLSRIFPTDGRTHMSTAVAGTPGYLDPEYHTTGWLNEKSDVYSFGVVLLEIITGRPAISRTQEKVHVSQWVSSMLAMGDIKTILDPRLRGDYEINSAWKAVELAMNCVSDTSNKRANMSEVVRGLKDCLEAELARTNVNRVTESTDSVIYSMNVTTELSPLAR